MYKIQIKSVTALLHALMHSYDLTPNDISGHCELDPKKPNCPGLDMDTFRGVLVNPGETERLLL